MSKNDEYVSHMRKLFFFSADPTTNLRPGETGRNVGQFRQAFRALNAAQDTERQNGSR